MATFIKVSATLLLLLITSSQFNEINCEQFEVWGDLRRSQIIIGCSKYKFAIPFIKRSIEITYPDEFDANESFGIVRGIKHSSNLDDGICQPETMLINGGINDRTATIKIISQRGCGLDSLVEFFIEQL